MSIDFEKDEFSYYAAALIFGVGGARTADFRIYSQPVLRQYKDIVLTETSGLNLRNVYDATRVLHINSNKAFTTFNCVLQSGINKYLRYTDTENSINIVDDVFNEHEYEYYNKEWNIVSVSKIKNLGTLIRSVYLGTLIDIPMFVNEFPSIAKVLLQYPELWTKEV